MSLPLLPLHTRILNFKCDWFFKDNLLYLPEDIDLEYYPYVKKCKWASTITMSPYDGETNHTIYRKWGDQDITYHERRNHPLLPNVIMYPYELIHPIESKGEVEFTQEGKTCIGDTRVLLNCQLGRTTLSELLECSTFIEQQFLLGFLRVIEKEYSPPPVNHGL